MATAIRLNNGTRVLCYGKLEGKITGYDFGDFTYRVQFDNSTVSGEWAWVSAGNLKEIVPPLSQGDKITRDSTEPPVGTLLEGTVPSGGHAARRNHDGWRTTWEASVFSWEELKRLLFTDENWQVRHIGNGSGY